MKKITIIAVIAAVLLLSVFACDFSSDEQAEAYSQQMDYPDEQPEVYSQQTDYPQQRDGDARTGQANCVICGGEGTYVCFMCNGVGMTVCHTCGGNGYIIDYGQLNGMVTGALETTACPTCKGEQISTCGYCGGQCYFTCASCSANGKLQEYADKKRNQ